MSDAKDKPLTLRDWAVIGVLLLIPLVNLVVLIIWAASGSTHPAKKNFAQLLLVLILVISFIAVLAALIMSISYNQSSIRIAI